MIKAKINEDLKGAMRAKDEVRTGTLRMLIGAIRNKEISLRQGESVELTDEQVVEVISSEIKKRKDSVEAYLKGSRQDLADRESAEIEILTAYLPIQLTDEELEVLVKEIVAGLPQGAAFGQAMGAVVPMAKGKADGARISAMVKKVLS